MKIIYTVISSILVFSIFSCGDDPVTPTNTITFTMSGQGDPTSYSFGFKPSVDTKITTIIAAFPDQNFADTIGSDPNYVYSRDTTYTWYDYQGVQTGQTWTFTFTGNIISNNQAYNAVSIFQVP